MLFEIYINISVIFLFFFKILIPFTLIFDYSHFIINQANYIWKQILIINFSKNIITHINNNVTDNI